MKKLTSISTIFSTLSIVFKQTMMSMKWLFFIHSTEVSILNKVRKEGQLVWSCDNQSPGVTPSKALKVRKKDVSLAKPESIATTDIFLSGWRRNRRLAYSTR